MRLKPRSVEDLRLRLMFLAATLAMRGIPLDEALTDVREGYEMAVDELQSSSKLLQNLEVEAEPLAESSTGTASSKEPQTIGEKVDARVRMAEQDAVIGELSSKLGDARAELADLRVAESFTEWGVRWPNDRVVTWVTRRGELKLRRFIAGVDPGPTLVSRTVTRTEWREVDRDV